MLKKIIFSLILLVLGVIFYSLSRQIYDSLQASARLDQAAEELTNLQVKNTQLKEKLKEVSSLEYVEKQARDKLNLSRPNETVVIIPQEEIDRLITSAKEATPPAIPHWQGWLKLFFH